MARMVDAIAVGIGAELAGSIGLRVESDRDQPDPRGGRILGELIAQGLHAGGRSGTHAGDAAAGEDEIERDGMAEEILLHHQTASLIPERHVRHQLIGHPGDHPTLVDGLTAEHVGDFGHAAEFLGVSRDDTSGRGLSAFREDVIADDATDPTDLAVALGETAKQFRRTIRLDDRRPAIRGDGNDLPGLGGGGKSGHGQEKEAEVVHVQRCSPEGPRSSSIMPCRTP